MAQNVTDTDNQVTFKNETHHIQVSLSYLAAVSVVYIDVNSSGGISCKQKYDLEGPLPTFETQMLRFSAQHT